MIYRRGIGGGATLYAPDSAAENQRVEFADLTKSFVGGSGVHVSMWPGFWDPTADKTTDAGGTGAAVRTNQTGARITFPVVTGTTFFAVHFDRSIWDAVNGNGQQWTARPSFWRVRRLIDGVYNSWRYGLRPSSSPGGWVIDHDLDPESTYRYELEPTHYTDHENFGTSALSPTVPLGDYMREPEITGVVNYVAAEQGAFQQISAFSIDADATYAVITYSGTSKKATFICDSNVHGLVLAQTGSATVEIASGNGLGTVEVDARGHAITGVRQAFENYCTTNGYRPIIHNISYGGLFLADVPDTVFAGYSFLGVHGLATPPISRYAKRTGYYRADATREGRANPSGWAPDLVIVALCTNDQVLGFSYAALGTGTPEFLAFSGTPFRDATKALANAIHATYASAKVLMVNNQFSDAVFGGIVATHQLFEDAMGPSHLNFPQAWGRYVDIRAAVSTSVIPDAFASLHLTATQHTAVAAALAADINALAP